MPLWSKIAAGLVIAVTLLGLVGLRAYSERLGPIVQTHGTTYYNGVVPQTPAAPCKSESEIRSAIARVHAKFDHFKGESLEAFEKRATLLKGLPPLSENFNENVTVIDKYYDKVEPEINLTTLKSAIDNLIAQGWRSRLAAEFLFWQFEVSLIRFRENSLPKGEPNNVSDIWLEHKGKLVKKHCS